MAKLKIGETTYDGEVFEMGGDAILCKFKTLVPETFTDTISIMDGDTAAKTYEGYSTVYQIEGLEVILTNSGRKLETAWDEADIEQLRAMKKQQMGECATAAIYYGVDVWGSHYSLQETDQLNITSAYTAVKNGAAEYPYHADGQLAKNYTAEEITQIYNAADEHKKYHTTYVNHLNRWIARAETTTELADIYYGVALPDDLKASMDEILGTADE